MCHKTDAYSKQKQNKIIPGGINFKSGQDNYKQHMEYLSFKDKHFFKILSINSYSSISKSNANFLVLWFGILVISFHGL